MSGYVREFYEYEANKSLMTFIPVGVTKYLHLLYHDSYYHFDTTYKYYGEYAMDKDIDRDGLNIEAQVILNQFLDRIEDDNYVHMDEEFMKQYVEKKGKLNDEFFSIQQDIEKYDHYNLLRFIWISFTKYRILY